MRDIKNIISKAKSGEYDENKIPNNQDSQKPSNQVTQEPSNPVIELPSNRAKKKKVKKKTMNFEVPADVGNYWMGKIKGEGNIFKNVAVSFLIKKYGLPEGYTREDL